MSGAGIITQARTTSTRLPGKVLVQVAGRTLLEHHLDRLRDSGHQVIVATTTNPADDPIVEIASRLGARCYRGSEHDVLSRFHECAVENSLDVIARVTSDCPLIDGKLVGDALTAFQQADDHRVYLTNGLRRTFPRGFDVEVFSIEALAEAHRFARSESQREHVTPYFYDGSDSSMQIRHISWPEDKSRYRVTVDTQDDLEVIRLLIEEHGAHRMGCREIIALLDRHPDITGLNDHVRQKELGQ